MHLRLSTCIGAEVVDRNAGDVVGIVSSIVLHPDTGKVEGIMVCIPVGMIATEHLFCSYEDIVHWGTKVNIRDRDALGPLSDRLRIAPFHAEGRTILHQRIRTKSGKSLGICRDVQFDTERMRLEWLFPRMWFRWGVALPATDILEVIPQAIIVRDGEIVDRVRVPQTSPFSGEGFPEIVEA